ncbi:MAG: putative rane-associated protein-like [Acidimicrobiales bacterium]|nr:putative rane-associated protein-like [Acidimicrobiales bacterium]
MLLASALTWLLHPDLEPLLRHGTPVFLAVVFLVVFAESGLLVGFFLPGDSFLFSAGLVAGVYHRPNILALGLVAFAAAVLGDQVGYQIGHRTGPRLFQRQDSRLFKQEHVRRAHDFFDRHGAKAIVLARFVPIVRTFTPVLAGVGDMKYRVFLTYNLIGGAMWSLLATLLGWGLGSRYPKLENYLTPIAVVIVLLSVAPMLYEVWKHRRAAVEKV